MLFVVLLAKYIFIFSQGSVISQTSQQRQSQLLIDKFNPSTQELQATPPSPQLLQSSRRSYVFHANRRQTNPWDLTIADVFPCDDDAIAASCPLFAVERDLLRSGCLMKLFRAKRSSNSPFAIILGRCRWHSPTRLYSSTSEVGHDKETGKGDFETFTVTCGAAGKITIE